MYIQEMRYNLSTILSRDRITEKTLDKAKGNEYI